MLRYTCIQFCILFLFFVIGCRPSTVKEQEQYFDIKSFFTQEIKRLNADSMQVSKQTRLSAATERKDLKIENWEKELALFVKCDINKPAWLGKYKVDTVKTLNSEVWELRHKALDASLKIQQLDVRFKDQEVESIIIACSTDNAIYEAQSFLSYSPKQGYSVKMEQDVQFFLFEKEAYNVEVQFLNK